MRNYCTLSDRTYLQKFLTLHESLLQHSREKFTLHLLAMDMETFWLVEEMKLKNVKLIPLQSFERELSLQSIRNSRSWQEYCWTCASSLLEYLMAWLSDEVVYLDADLMFFSDPKIVFDEIGERSIGITPHRFPESRKHKEINGLFNVGWVSAKFTEAGRRCIRLWAANCRMWCFNRIEANHACGDQKYLDTWQTDFPDEVCAIQNIGVNLAPWNCEQYEITEGPKANNVPVVFYHLHEFESASRLTFYPVSDDQRQFIYEPYIDAWREAGAQITRVERRLAQRKLVESEAQRA